MQDDQSKHDDLLSSACEAAPEQGTVDINAGEPEGTSLAADNAAGGAPSAEAASEREPSKSEALSWCFGRNAAASVPQPPKSFVPVFLSIIAVCLALLILLLFIGDAGLTVYREVHTEHTIYVREDGTVSGVLSASEAASIAAKSTVTIIAMGESAQSIGSGFVYTADGYIVTNHHVVEGMSRFQVKLPTGEAIDATLRGSNEHADIAILKVERSDLVPMALGSSSNLTVGADVIALGTPGSLDNEGTVTFGNVSALNRFVPVYDNLGNVLYRMKLIQTDTELNPGNSGGPLVDRNGKVVGINNRRLFNYNGDVFIGIGYAIPIDEAKIVIDAIIDKGAFTGENPVAVGKCTLGITGRGLLGGYWYSDLQAETVERSEIEKPGYTYIPYDGVYVTEVSGSNVIGKLEIKDIITRINGLVVRTIQDVIGEINRYPAYSNVKLTVMRQKGGKYEEVTVEVRLGLADLA